MLIFIVKQRNYKNENKPGIYNGYILDTYMMEGKLDKWFTTLMGKVIDIEMILQAIPYCFRA